MKIKKVDDKPMVIHTKEKAKIHAHEPKGAKIKGSNIYTVERGPKVHDAKANEMDKKASAKLMLQKSAAPLEAVPVTGRLDSYARYAACDISCPPSTCSVTAPAASAPVLPAM